MIFFYFILSDAVISLFPTKFNRMFPSTLPLTPGFSPICDNKGDVTVHIISTPFFNLVSPSPVQDQDQETVAAVAGSASTENICRRLSYSSDWTTDSEPDVIEISGYDDNEFRWSATP